MTTTLQTGTHHLRSTLVWLVFIAGPLATLAMVEMLELPAVDWRNLWGWLGASSPEAALVALAAVTVRVAAIWVLASTVATGMAMLAGRPSLARSVARLAVPAVRRLAVRMAAVTLAVGPSVAPVVATALEPAPVAAAWSAMSEPDPLVPPFLLPPPSGTEVTVATTAPDPGGAVDPSPVARPAPVPPFLIAEGGSVRAQPPGAGSGPTPPPASGAIRHTVADGDHLWAIAERRLTDARGERPRLADLTGYWLRVIEANRGIIRSGDPDLIYPGEVVELPPIETS